MRKTVPMTFGELWKDFVESSPGAAHKLAEARVTDVWPRLVGPMVASSTLSINIVKGVMYARIASAAARSEIFMRREELKDAINEAVGRRVVNVLIVK